MHNRTLYINPYIFLLLKDGKFILWNYKDHSQYEIEDEYLLRLKQISCSSDAIQGDLSSQDQALLEAGMISLSPYPPIHWQWDELGKIYHIGTQDICTAAQEDDQQWMVNYVNHCQQVAQSDAYEFTSYPGHKINLPPHNFSTLHNVNLATALSNRSTSRHFNGTSISQQDLSTLLFASFGLIHGNWDELSHINLKQLGIRKAQPSGGGLHPVEAYLLVFHIHGIPPGIYHYDIKSHELSYLNQICSEDQLQHILCGQFFAKGIALGIFLTAHFDKVWHKYGHSRSYKDVYLDAGHASQTFLLVATALDLLTWETAWFRDSEAAHLLKVDGISAAPLFFLGVGNGEKVAIPPKLARYLNPLQAHNS